MLTRKQLELLRFIHERLKEAGVPPSFDEMKDALDLRSKSGIHRLITALEERGFIRRLPNRARAIEVIKLPESVAHGIGSSRARGFTPSVIEGNLGRVRTGSEDESGRPVAVPVMGRIAAGTPVEAIQSKTQNINMTPEMLSTTRGLVSSVSGVAPRGAGRVDAAAAEASFGAAARAQGRSWPSGRATVSSQAVPTRRSDSAPWRCHSLRSITRAPQPGGASRALTT